VLRESDVFVDVGANVGVYTVIAGAAVGCACHSFEPVPATFASLLDNVHLNDVAGRVTCSNAALGRAPGSLRMTTGLGPMNHVAVGGAHAVEVPVRTLDEQPLGPAPRVVKIDVEGWETEVVAGGMAALSDPGTMAIVMELNGSGDRYGFDEAALHARILSLGYHTVAYDSVARTLSPQGGGPGSSDTLLYVRDASAAAERVRAAPRYAVHGTEL
jgi:FkbM family methyltransferase